MNITKVIIKAQYCTTQPNINLSWVRHENGFANHPTQYLSCCSTDFDETLNVGSWEHLE